MPELAWLPLSLKAWVELLARPQSSASLSGSSTLQGPHAAFILGTWHLLGLGSQDHSVNSTPSFSWGLGTSGPILPSLRS